VQAALLDPIDHCISIDLSQENQNTIAEAILEYDIGVIVHCAGSATSDSESLIRDNLKATTVLINAVSYGKRGLPFCHLGSSAEYKPLKKPQKTTEKTPTEPVGEYGKVKLQTTKEVLKASFQGDISGYVLRLFNPIGNGMPETNLVGRVCEILRNEQEQYLSLGNLNSFRDYVDIRDVARAIIQASNR
jgi:nucleoside-diphosphate-sugar epimerase